MLKRTIFIFGFLYSMACYSSDNNYSANIFCHYQVSNDVTNPASGVIKAKDDLGKEIKIPGRNSSFNNKYLFITDVDLLSLYKICENTLQHEGIKTRALFVNASRINNILEANIWSTDQSVKVNDYKSSKIERLVSFGDSLSDTNNAFTTLWHAAPHKASWFWGHFSNGKVWTEYLSEQLNVPLYNWSVGAALAGNKEIRASSDFNRQIETFFGQVSSDKKYNIKNTLFTILFGANDIRFGKDVSSSVNALYNGIEGLIANGARNIVIMTLPDISLAPDYSAKEDDELREKIHNEVIVYNQELKDMVNKVVMEQHKDISIHLIELDVFFADLIKNPAKYGITNVTESCLKIEKGDAEYTQEFPPRESCLKDPRFVFWDRVHPTTAVHQILAKEVASQLLAIYK